LVDKLILKNQTAFMKGRDIMNGIMALHEILHETKRSKKAGIALRRVLVPGAPRLRDAEAPGRGWM
jgi:hypothetical protein